MSLHVRVGLALLLALGIVGIPRAADALTGSASLTGTLTLAAKGCGREHGTFVTAVSVADDGTWSAQSTEGVAFGGTYTTKGSGGRTLVLAFDEPSTSGLLAMIEADVSSLCHTQATVTSSRAKTFALKLNRKLTKAVLVLKYAFTGNAGGRTGTATYRLHARGPWIAG